MSAQFLTGSYDSSKKKKKLVKWDKKRNLWAVDSISLTLLVCLDWFYPDFLFMSAVGIFEKDILLSLSVLNPKGKEVTVTPRVLLLASQGL